MSYIEFINVKKTYNMGEVEINALNNTSFKVEKGESKKALEAKKREEETLKKEKRQENLRLREEERQKKALEDAGVL